jgi:DHA2 family multidrug resistance protein
MLGIFTTITGLLMIDRDLLPPFLQQLKGYPVFTTGIVLAPRFCQHDDFDVHGRA